MIRSKLKSRFGRITQMAFFWAALALLLHLVPGGVKPGRAQSSRSREGIQTFAMASPRSKVQGPRSLCLESTLGFGPWTLDYSSPSVVSRMRRGDMGSWFWRTPVAR